MNKKLLATAIGISTVALRAVSVASAATNTTTSSTTSSLPARHGRGGRPHFMQDKNGDLAAFLKLSASDLQSQFSSGKRIDQIAAAQGITQDQLKQFFDSEHQKMIDALKQKLAVDVASGKITQTQMDDMLQKMANGPQGGPHGMHDPKNTAKLAAFLGMNQTDLDAALKTGTKLEDIAVQHGKTTDQLQAFFQSEQQARLDQLKQQLASDVASGKITQAQADKRIQNMTNHTSKGHFRGPRH